jgi:hypothetical protein
MPPLPDQGTAVIARLSYTTRVSVAQSAALAMSMRDGDSVEASLTVRALNNATLVVTIQEGDDLTTWTPLGLSQAVAALGSVAVTRSGITKRYVRVLLEAVGGQGGEVVVQVTSNVSRT